MDTFLYKLKNNIILSKEDILLLKNNINEKNPNLDSSVKAHILSKSIHNALDKSLKGFTKDYKSSIKPILIKNTLLNNVESICQYDVLKACAASQDTSLEFIYQINKWVNTQVNDEIELNVIKKVIKKINDDEAEANIKKDIDLIKTLKKDDDNMTIDKINTLKIAENHKSIVENIINYKNKVYEFIKLNLSIKSIKKYILIYSLALCLLIIPVSHIINAHIIKEETIVEVVASPEYNNIQLKFEKNDIDFIISKDIEIMTSHLPDNFKYKPINKEGLRSYLIKRNSLLSKEPYFSTIISCAKEFNLNPVILFSIAGHEQSFVPKDHDNANKIVNNPYNIFQSWQKYNTNLVDSSKIACRTIINLLKDRPENADPFKWINRKYAEDRNWWKGVQKIYNALEEIAN